MHKSFRSLAEARAWLLGVADAAVADAAPPYSCERFPPTAPLTTLMPTVYGIDPGASSSQAPSSQEEPPTQYCMTQETVTMKDEEIEDISIAHSQHAMMIDGPTAMSTQPPPSTAFGDSRMNIDAPAQPELPTPQEIQLSPEQQHVLDMVKQGKSVFFTGSAGLSSDFAREIHHLIEKRSGTGKSVLLREIIKLRGGRPSVRLGVTASTGIASVNIGGCTLHSWAGIGLGKEDQDALVGKILGIASREYKEEKKRREELLAKKRASHRLTEEEEVFLKRDPNERKSKVLDRWRLCQTLIIDESELWRCMSYMI